jgi:putative hydrolase of the HAD superfamily
MSAESAMATAWASPPETSTRPSLKSPLDPRRRIRAVLFDLDGTLYRQMFMRGLMAIELMALAFCRPLRAGRTWRTLAAYRKAQEVLRLRETAGLSGSSSIQAEIVAQQTGVTTGEIDSIVTEWMLERPLKYLPVCRASGLVELLAFLEEKGLEVGVLSDYPADAKLRALGLRERFSLVLCSTDPDIGVFKPNPRGFRRACERWQLEPGEVLVVGDRIDVDGHGAAAAAMPCVIIRYSSSRLSSHSGLDPRGFLVLPSLERLRDVLDDGC